MEKELDVPKDRPTLVLEKYLDSSETLRSLLSNTQAKDDVLDKASVDIGDLDTNETNSFVKMLLNGLSRDDQQWGVDKRDGALELFDMVDFNKIPRERLLTIYLDSVSTQNGDSDPWGSIYSLIEAGKIIAPFLSFGLETRQKVDLAWLNVENQFSEEEKEVVDKGVDQILSHIAFGPEDLIGHQGVMLGGRDRPRFNSSEQVLHDKYLEVTREQKTFKLALWENTPQFRTLCQSHGIELERFWNMNNPDEVDTALQGVPWEEYPQAQILFNKVLESETGFNLYTLTPETSRVLADEIVISADKAKTEIVNTIGDFGSIINRFKILVDDAREKGTRAQRRLTTQIANFLRENEVIVGSTNFDSIITILYDTESLQTAELAFAQKQQSKRDAVAILDNAFHFENKTKDFVLASRQREDLFLGDLTGDCTAYHLHVGMNAWTVPIWLSNPGFNFYKITDGDQLVSKLGILLAAAQSKPVLVVDSFEVSQGIPDQQAAIEQIKEGLTNLREWAEGIGIEKVLINTVSNSSGAAELLRNIDITEQSDEPGLHALGGLSGVSELRQRLTNQKVDERIYIQSKSWDFDVEVEQEWDTEEQARLSGELEQLVGSTINKAKPEDKGRIEDLARSQNWAELFKFIVDINYPTVSKVLGNDWDRYKGFMDVIEIDEMDSPYRAGEDSKYFIDRLPVSTIIEEQFIEEAARRNIEADDEDYYEDPLVKEADKVDEFLITLKQMEKNGLTPEIVLEKLYGQTTVEQDDNQEGDKELALNRRLPRLII